MKKKKSPTALKNVSNDEYVLVTYEFGEPLFIGELDANFKITTTENKSKATIWGELDAISEMKLNYHRAVTGYKELIFEKLKK